jgi:hypothetical protein
MPLPSVIGYPPVTPLPEWMAASTAWFKVARLYRVLMTWTPMLARNLLMRSCTLLGTAPCQ